MHLSKETHQPQLEFAVHVVQSVALTPHASGTTAADVSRAGSARACSLTADFKVPLGGKCVRDADLPHSKAGLIDPCSVRRLPVLIAAHSPQMRKRIRRALGPKSSMYSSATGKNLGEQHSPWPLRRTRNLQGLFLGYLPCFVLVRLRWSAN